MAPCKGKGEERVNLRVQKGGHGIPDDDIERRYIDSLNNLNKVIELCDEIKVYDNTKLFEQVMYIKNGELIWKEKVLPNWVEHISIK